MPPAFVWYSIYFTQSINSSSNGHSYFTFFAIVPVAGFDTARLRSTIGTLAGVSPVLPLFPQRRHGVVYYLCRQYLNSQFSIQLTPLIQFIQLFPLIDNRLMEKPRHPVLNPRTTALRPITQHIYRRTPQQMPKANNHAHPPWEMHQWKPQKPKSKRCLHPIMLRQPPFSLFELPKVVRVASNTPRNKNFFFHNIKIFTFQFSLFPTISSAIARQYSSATR